MTIIVGVDGSPAGRRALAWAVEEGRLRGSGVCAVHVWDIPGHAGFAGRTLAAPVDDAVVPELVELRRAAESRLAEAVAEVEAADGVEQRVLQGRPAEALVEQARGADLLVVGSRGHGSLAGVLLGSVSQACTRHATCPVVVVRDADAPGVWHPDEVIAREIAQNAHTWEALQRLGVREGDELELEFLYETGGPDADRELAEYLRRKTGYAVSVEPGGVGGLTGPMAVSPAIIDAWVTRMVLAGYENGGCAFDGWTATVSAGAEVEPAPEG